MTNPFESPQTFETPVYYSTNIVRAQAAEIRRIVGKLGPLTWAIIYFHKIIGRPIFAGFGIAHDSIKFITVEETPTYAMDSLSEVMAEFEAMEAKLLVAHTVDSIGKIESFALNYLMPDNKIHGAAIYTKSELSGQKMELVETYVGSILEDNRRVSTTSSAQRLNTPPEFVAEYLVGVRLAELVARHQQRLTEIDSPAMVLDEAMVREALQENSRLSVKFHRNRKVMIPLSENQVAQIRLEQSK